MFRRLLLTAVPLAAVVAVAATFSSAHAVAGLPVDRVKLKSTANLVDKRLIPAPERDRLVTVPNKLNVVNKLNQINKVNQVNQLNKLNVVHLQHKLDRFQRSNLVIQPATKQVQPLPRPAQLSK